MRISWFFSAFGYEVYIYREPFYRWRWPDVWQEDVEEGSWEFNLGRTKGVISPVKPVDYDALLKKCLEN